MVRAFIVARMLLQHQRIADSDICRRYHAPAMCQPNVGPVFKKSSQYHAVKAQNSNKPEQPGKDDNLLADNKKGRVGIPCLSRKLLCRLRKRSLLPADSPTSEGGTPATCDTVAAEDVADAKYL